MAGTDSTVKVASAERDAGHRTEPGAARDVDDAPLVVGGRRVRGAGDPYRIVNPARPGELVGSAPTADIDQLDAAVGAARAAASDWAARPADDRVATVVAAATRAAGWAAEADLATTYTREHGKVRAEAEFELVTVPVIAQILGDIAVGALAPDLVEPPSPTPRVERVPYGVAALVLPFNWPVALGITKLAGALATGNTAVVKAPPTCPLVLLNLFAELADALPAGVVNVVSGAGADLGRRLVSHPGVDVVSFTGGVATGRAVMAAAAEQLTPVLLELGGNDAAIVAPDLPVTDALADQLFAATFTTTGQVCMAVKRLYAPRERVAELVDALLARGEREVVGDGLASDVTLGPVHTGGALERVRRLVADAQDRGGRVQDCGTLRAADVDGGGYFMLPTVVTGLPPDAALVADEQFGPVLPVLGYDTVDDAVRAANATPFGLTASVWTSDDELAERAAGALVAGTVSINCHGMAAQDPRLPFGGVGDSGMGRELGVDGVRGFTQSRSVVRRDPPA